MKYENAKDILPPELLEQVQKYAAGKLLYIPKSEEAKAWGSISGSRQKLLLRNQRIYNEYIGGKGIGELAEEYFLSTDSIKKIVYGKKQEWVVFHPTLECAMKYNELGLDEEWIRLFYAEKFEGKTYSEDWICDGLVRVPLRLIEASKTAENTMEGEESTIEEPLLLLYTERRFIYLGASEVLGQLKYLRRNSHPAFIFIKDKKEYSSYVKQYGRHFHQARLN